MGKSFTRNDNFMIDSSVIAMNNEGLPLSEFRVTAAKIAAGAIANVHIAADAAIEYSKLTGVAGLDANGKVIPAQASAEMVRIETAAATLGTAHAGKLVIVMDTITSDNGVNITLSKNNANELPLGTEIEIFNYYNGTVTITPANGFGLMYPGMTSAASAITINHRYGTVVLKRVFTSYWVVAGDI